MIAFVFLAPGLSCLPSLGSDWLGIVGYYIFILIQFTFMHFVQLLFYHSSGSVVGSGFIMNLMKVSMNFTVLNCIYPIFDPHYFLKIRRYFGYIGPFPEEPQAGPGANWSWPGLAMHLLFFLCLNIFILVNFISRLKLKVLINLSYLMKLTDFFLCYLGLLLAG